MSQFTDKVTAFCKFEGIFSITTKHCPGCEDRRDTGQQRRETDETPAHCCVPFFSHSSCECCGGLAGDRYECNAYHEESGQILEYDICIDCLVWFANGEEPTLCSG